MSSESKTCQCSCEVSAEGNCVCTCTISADQKGTTEWTCECTCNNGQKCVCRFKLDWAEPEDGAEGETNTFTCQCKCGSAGGTCTMNIVKPKHCTVTCIECGVDSGSGQQCEGKKCCQKN